ncbi:TatD family hydrolase [bacterium]|nr:TatD family hydrolase [bacterium]
MLIDTHAHLNFKNFNKDRDEAISRAFQSGVKKIINIGTDLKESKASVKLAEKYENVYAAVGMHPTSLVTQNSKLKTQIEKLRKLAENKKVVAIGEIGLDYYHVVCSMKYGARGIEKVRKRQKEGFIGQLELAKELNLPVIIHCRASEQNPADAYEDVYAILSENEESRNNIASVNRTGSLGKLGMTKLVFHCYSGDLEFTKKLLKHKNIHFSFTGNITYKTKKEIQGTEKDIAEIIKIIPLERIMLETDCPFLAPQKFRGKRNEPAYVKYTAEKLAEIKRISFEEVEKITTQNAENFFGI